MVQLSLCWQFCLLLRLENPSANATRSMMMTVVPAADVADADIVGTMMRHNVLHLLKGN